MGKPVFIVTQKQLRTVQYLFQPPHIMIILRLTPLPQPPLCKKFPPIDSFIPTLLVGALPTVQTPFQITLRRISKSHQNHWTLNHQKSHQNHWTLNHQNHKRLCHLHMIWEIPHLLQHLWRLRFPRAWVRTRSINSALLPLILRLLCFRYILSCLSVSAFTSFSIVQAISGKVFLSPTLFLAFASRNSRCCT